MLGITGTSMDLLPRNGWGKILHGAPPDSVLSLVSTFSLKTCRRKSRGCFKKFAGNTMLKDELRLYRKKIEKYLGRMERAEINGMRSKKKEM